MANHGCINGTIKGVNYSSPVPVIGLYISAASFLYMAMMLYDIGSGFCARKRWLPCKSFKLNALTLTLLGIAAKLPVDLTSEMPSPKDQLSKLTGTAFICISMGFLAPSLGVNSESDCFTNLIALSLFVIIVAVNICLQLYTGVIVLFIPEHIMTLGLMLLMLLMLWHISSKVKIHKRITSDRYNDLFTKGRTNMFERLKLCYLYAYCCDPQFHISIHPMNAAVGTICLMCSVILLQTSFRSLILKRLEFCQGISAYRWSMIIIVVIQILTVIIGTFAVVFRWLSLFSRMEYGEIVYSFFDGHDARQMNQTLGKGLSLLRLRKFFATQIVRLVLVVQLLIVSPSVLVRFLLRVYQQDELERFDAIPHEGVIAATDYIVRKGVDDMIRLKEVFYRESLDQLVRLLSHKCLSQRVRAMEIRDQAYPQRKVIQVSSLSIALLVKITQASMPHDLLEPILHVFSEAREIIHFIDETIQPKSSENNIELSYAKALWVSGDFSCLLPDDINGTRTLNQHQRAVAIITELRNKMKSVKVWSQVGDIIDFIDPGSCLSIQNLYSSMEQLFVDMLHAVLSQLPNAIFKSLSESPPEEFENRVQLALKFLITIGCLEDRIEWIPPVSNIPRIITPDLRVISGRLARFCEVVPKVPDTQNENGAGEV